MENKKKKDAKAAPAPEKDEVKAADPQNKETAGAANAPETGAEEKTEKELSETEVLKLFIEQMRGQIRKLQAEKEEAAQKAEENEAKAEQFRQKLALLVGEYDNYRRRTAEEKENLYAEAVAKAVKALLPAIDSLEKATESVGASAESLQQGVEMTLRQLRSGFESLGVTEIEAEGSPFDPEKHNAVMHVEDDSLGEAVVAEVFQKGYAINDWIIRHSMVKVAN